MAYHHHSKLCQVLVRDGSDMNIRTNPHNHHSNRPNFPYLTKKKDIFSYSLPIQKSRTAILGASPCKDTARDNQVYLSTVEVKVPECIEKRCQRESKQKQQRAQMKSTKLRFNSTYRKIIMSKSLEKQDSQRRNFSRQGNQEYIPRKVINLSQRVVNNMFTPRLVKKDRVKKNEEILRKCLEHFANSMPHRKESSDSKIGSAEYAYSTLSVEKRLSELKEMEISLQRSGSLSKNKVVVIQGRVTKNMLIKKQQKNGDSVVSSKISRLLKPAKRDFKKWNMSFSPWSSGDQDDTF